MGRHQGGTEPNLSTSSRHTNLKINNFIIPVALAKPFQLLVKIERLLLTTFFRLLSISPQSEGDWITRHFCGE